MLRTRAAPRQGDEDEDEHRVETGRDCVDHDLWVPEEARASRPFHVEPAAGSHRRPHQERATIPSVHSDRAASELRDQLDQAAERDHRRKHDVRREGEVPCGITRGVAAARFLEMTGQDRAVVERNDVVREQPLADDGHEEPAAGRAAQDGPCQVAPAYRVQILGTRWKNHHGSIVRRARRRDSCVSCHGVTSQAGSFGAIGCVTRPVATKARCDEPRLAPTNDAGARRAEMPARRTLEADIKDRRERLRRTASSIGGSRLSRRFTGSGAGRPGRSPGGMLLLGHQLTRDKSFVEDTHLSDPA